MRKTNFLIEVKFFFQTKYIPNKRRQFNYNKSILVYII